MTQSIEHQMTQIYCFIDDYLNAHPQCAHWRRSPHSVPRFSDAEVLTIVLLQGDIWGRFLNIILTPGAVDGRDPLLALCEGTDGGVMLGDLGYRGNPAATFLAQEADVLLIIRRDAPRHKFLLSQVRQAIETSFSQLWHQFIDRAFSRSWNGLCNTIKLKVLFYNIRHAGIVSV